MADLLEDEFCPYCELHRSDIGRCKLGFPGCGLADDLLEEFLSDADFEFNPEVKHGNRDNS